jgi:hypothetical protein
MKVRRFLAGAGTVSLLLAGLLGTSQKVFAAPRRDGDRDPKQVSMLLVDAKTVALQVKDDAITMQGYTRTDLKWEAHAATLAKMREHLTILEDQVTTLKALAGAAEPWQKTVIVRIEPYLTALAKDNEAVIDEMDAHPSLFGTPAANAYLDANANSAAYLADLIASLVDSGSIREKIQDYDQPEDTCGLMGEAARAIR